jgi:hypothetical protein
MQLLPGEIARRKYHRRHTDRSGSHLEAVYNPESSVSAAQLTSLILDALSLPSPMATSSYPEDSDDKAETLSDATSSHASSQSSRRESCSMAGDDDRNIGDACKETSNGDNNKA